MSRLKLKGPVLVTGSHGMLGTEFGEALSGILSASELILTDKKNFDLTNPTQVGAFLKETRPHWVINTAAYTQVDKAETERDLAYSVNASGPRILAKACSENAIKLVHFSTDYVFSGEGNTPWVETDLPCPRIPNWYGETKLLGERAVLEFPQHLVFRVQWLYGKKRERFSLLKDRTEFTPFCDQYGAPTWTQDIVETTLQVMAKEGSGLFHLSYDDFGSWYEVYQLVKEEWGLSTELIPKKSEEVSLPAKRPLNGRLSNLKLKNFLKVESLGSWKTSLRKFLKQVAP